LVSLAYSNCARTERFDHKLPFVTVDKQNAVQIAAGLRETPKKCKAA
jgi:hypothetical protein